MNLEAARSELFKRLRQEIHDQGVLEAMARIPRELFVSPADQHLSYADIPLPIGLGQTISQPFIVALMTQALELKGGERVLEVGTGSGYQTALLAELAGHVVSVERYESLAEEARRRLDSLGYRNVEIHVGNGSLGWSQGGPYDAIIVTAGAPSVPQELVGQLKEGGRLVIPVGSRYDQELFQVLRLGERVEKRSLGLCRFVPLTGQAGWPEE